VPKIAPFYAQSSGGQAICRICSEVVNLPYRLGMKRKTGRQFAIDRGM